MFLLARSRSAHILAMEVMMEETFGPVIAIMKVQYLREVVYRS